MNTTTPRRAKRPTTQAVMHAFMKHGYRFHSFGTLSKGGAKLWDYYKADSITEEQTAAFRASWGDAFTLKWCGSEYAPEQARRPMVCIAKAAQLRNPATV